MELETLHDMYVDELKDLYSAENQILKALPRMIKAATHPELKKAFTQHEKQTRTQVRRLEQVCKELGVKPKGKKCVGMEGVLKEGAELIKEKPGAEALDAGLLAKAQHVEHYEMAGYGTVRTWARALGYENQANLLQQTLDEEQATDILLTEIAVRAVNVKAESPEGEE
jgi:ferritin-like metal-binding protein YciE